MKILKFKTDIYNEEKENKLSALLDQHSLVSKWKVDTAHEDNILSVSGKDITADVIIDLLNEKGVSAELIHVQAIGGHDL